MHTEYSVHCTSQVMALSDYQRFLSVQSMYGVISAFFVCTVHVRCHTSVEAFTVQELNTSFAHVTTCEHRLSEKAVAVQYE